jgi:hypothetical protein
LTSTCAGRRRASAPMSSWPGRSRPCTRSRRAAMVLRGCMRSCAARDPGPEVIFHSDRGCPVHLRRVRLPSPVNPRLDLQTWPSRAAARHTIVEYIGWFNSTRLAQHPGLSQRRRYQAATSEEVTEKVA